MDIKNMDVRLICAGFALLGIFVLPNLASAGLAMFWDDFEQDKLGGQPSQWKYAAGNQKGEIIKDPKDGSNQVFSMPDRFPRGSFGFYVIGDKTWTTMLSNGIGCQRRAIMVSISATTTRTTII